MKGLGTERSHLHLLGKYAHVGNCRCGLTCHNPLKRGFGNDCAKKRKGATRHSGVNSDCGAPHGRGLLGRFEPRGASKRLAVRATELVRRVSCSRLERSVRPKLATTPALAADCGCRQGERDMAKEP